MDYNPNHRYRLQLQVPYYRIPKTRNRNRLAMKYQYFRYLAFSRFPFHSGEIYLKATSKENAIERLKRYLNKNEVSMRFNPFLLSEITRQEYNKILRQPKLPIITIL